MNTTCGLCKRDFLSRIAPEGLSLGGLCYGGEGCQQRRSGKRSLFCGRRGQAAKRQGGCQARAAGRGSGQKVLPGTGLSACSSGGLRFRVGGSREAEPEPGRRVFWSDGWVGMSRSARRSRGKGKARVCVHLSQKWGHHACPLLARGKGVQPCLNEVGWFWSTPGPAAPQPLPLAPAAHTFHGAVDTEVLVLPRSPCAPAAHRP